MKVGLTFDYRQDYGFDESNEVFADFCSPAEVEHIVEAIRLCGHEPVLIGNMYKLNERIKAGCVNCDLIFIEDEGILSRNREAIVPALLELNRIPYVGSDAYAMGLSQNKHHTKLIAQSLGIPSPNGLYVGLSKQLEAAALEKELKDKKLAFPLVVKPNYEGYSMGVFLVDTVEELIEKIRYNREKYDQAVLCEQYIKGEEVNVPVIGNGDGAYALGVDRCAYEDGSSIDLFTVHDKCFRVIRDEAASFGVKTDRALLNYSLWLHRHLECRDFSRSDFRVDEQGKVWFLEINPRPGLTRGGPFEACGKARGMAFPEILGDIIRCALERQGMG